MDFMITNIVEHYEKGAINYSENLKKMNVQMKIQFTDLSEKIKKVEDYDIGMQKQFSYLEEEMKSTKLDFANTTQGLKKSRNRTFMNYESIYQQEMEKLGSDASSTETKNQPKNKCKKMIFASSQ